jgi:putative redox protein
VRLRHFRDYAADCKDCEDKDAKMERIERVIDLAGALDDGQRARLLEIAEKCPVHRTLEARVKVDSRLAE